MPTLRVCLVPGCGQPTTGSRCAMHAMPPRGRAYRQARAQTLSEEGLCWLCGLPGTPADPLNSADHVTARAHGGSNDRSNLRAAHLTCNQRRGATDLEAGVPHMPTPTPRTLRASTLESFARRIS